MAKEVLRKGQMVMSSKPLAMDGARATNPEATDGRDVRWVGEIQWGFRSHADFEQGTIARVSLYLQGFRTGANRADFANIWELPGDHPVTALTWEKMRGDLYPEDFDAGDIIYTFNHQFEDDYAKLLVLEPVKSACEKFVANQYGRKLDECQD
jgi:hypothetical protein